MERKVGKKIDIGVRRRKDVSETESSIFRQLEKEDLQRFTTIKEEANARELRKAYGRKMHIEDNDKEMRKDSRRVHEKGKRNSGRKELVGPKKQRMGRFLQQRICNRINKRWHSDSELLDSTSKGASAASRKGKFDESHGSMMKHSNDRKDMVPSKYSKIHQEVLHNCRQEKYHESTVKDVFDKNNMDPVRDGSGVNDKHEWTKNNDTFKWMNCSFPATIRESNTRRNICEYGGLSPHHSGMINLLIEYFKDLNKEVREFREEKKRTREQIQQLELKVEKLVLRLEAQDAMIQTHKSNETQISVGNQTEDNGNREEEAQSCKANNNMTTRSENVCMELEARPEIRQEIRNILADVHDKYHKQLVEHEKRMKCVQEKAEFDIQNLMKTIVANYVELSNLRGTGKELDKLFIQRKIDDEKPNVSSKNANSTNSEGNEVIATTNAKELCFKKCAGVIASQNKVCYPSNPGPPQNTRAEMIRKSYKFYFPKQIRAECKQLQSTVNEVRRTDTAGIGENESARGEIVTTGAIYGNDVNIIATREIQEGRSQDEATKAPVVVERNDSSLPEGLGASYLEWKKYWRDKLLKRNSLVKAKKDKKVKADDGNGGAAETTEELIRNNT